MRDRPLEARVVHADEHRLAVRVDDGSDAQLLEYVGQGPTWQQLPPTHDFVAVALSHHAAATGRDLVVDGPVSSSQLDRLAEFVDVWATWLPQRFARVSISATHEVPRVQPGPRRGAVLAFSGGVDASFALAAHHDGLPGRRTRSISTGVLAVGWDLAHSDDQACTVAQQRVTEALCTYGVGTRVVATNWAQWFGSASSASITVGLAALLATFAGDHDAALIGADHAYRDELAIGPTGMHTSVLHLLGSDHFPLGSTGGTQRRLDRLRHLTGHPALLRNLRVCDDRDGAGANCGRCPACVRTQLEMHVVGIDATPHFTRAMTLDDLAAVRLPRTDELIFAEDVLEQLPAADPLRPRLAALLRRERLAAARRAGDPVVALLDDTRLQLAATQAEADALRSELATVHASRTWRATEPVRAWRARRGGRADAASG